jgi:hypothetical protein
VDDREEETTGAGRKAGIAACVAVVAGLLAWLWPIGLGGKMPVGGDVTSFSIGLMAELGRTIRSARIPYWNDLWGYGFPGLAESQMGVYYPPHLVLYGLFPVEWAYTASLVLHTLWAGLGALWAARRFGVSVGGSIVSGLAWGMCGFFLVHLPHHWGATTASWMPWAWGLAWSIATGSCRPRAALWLAAVLTLQILPGHFQLAFTTQTTTCVVGLCGLAAHPGSPRWRRAGRLVLAVLAVVPLAMAQLWPTAELAELAGSSIDIGYLASFASTPLHLVSYVAPGLFHESPLWRPLAWDAFHAMPEEHLATIGLVPLFLAVVALRVGWRDPIVRALAAVVVVATWFSLGRYVPGFATIARLPGFAFFRAPARWGGAAMLGLAILAGRGFDAIAAADRAGRWLRWFVVLAAAWPALVVGSFEIALLANETNAGKPSWSAVARGFDAAFRAIPWRDEPSLSTRLAAARKPLDDPRVPVALARRGRPFEDADDRTLTMQRRSIYAMELGPTYVLLALLFAASFLARGRPRTFRAALLGILIAEAGYWSRRHPFDLGPIRPLTEQSAVLARVAEMPRGTRWVGPGRNLPMVASAAPISAYRTLDLASMPELTGLADGPARLPEVSQALRAAGVGVRVAEGDATTQPPGWDVLDVADDPTLLGWLTGADWVRILADRAPSRFVLQTPAREPARAWFVSTGVAELAKVGDDPRGMLAALGQAQAVGVHASRPEELTLAIEAGRPGAVVLTQLWYPRWRATLAGASGEKSVPIQRVFHGGQAIEIPSAGSWTLRLVYDSLPDRMALAVSGLAWLGWFVLYWRSAVRAARPLDISGIGETDG